MVEKKFHCIRCRMQITLSQMGVPDKKMGGPCPKDSRGQHAWMPG